MVVDVHAAMAADCRVGNRFSNVVRVIRALAQWLEGSPGMPGTDDSVLDDLFPVSRRR